MNKNLTTPTSHLSARHSGAGLELEAEPGVLRAANQKLVLYRDNQPIRSQYCDGQPMRGQYYLCAAGEAGEGGGAGAPAQVVGELPGSLHWTPAPATLVSAPSPTNADKQTYNS